MLSNKILYGYTWWLLKTNVGLETTNYGGRIPIVPFSDESDFTDFDEPYIIYGYSETTDDVINFESSGVMTFIIRSKRLSEVSDITEVLLEAYRREDLSANDINTFVTKAAGTDLKGISFKHIKVDYIEPGSPERTQEGKISGIVSIRYTYCADSNIVTTADVFDL